MYDCVLLEMETVDSEVKEDEGCVDVEEAYLPSEPGQTEPTLSAATVGPCDNPNSTETNDEDLSVPHLEPFHDSAEAACSSTAVDDAVETCEASEAADVSDASETQSPHHSDENVPRDCAEDGISRSAEPVDSSIGELEDRSETSEVDETQSVAATSEEDGWMYVLGHDQLKKRACTLADFFSFFSRDVFSTVIIAVTYQTRRQTNLTEAALPPHMDSSMVFSGWCQWECALHLMLPRADRSPRPKQHLDQFSHFCTARCRESL